MKTLACLMTFAALATASESAGAQPASATGTKSLVIYFSLSGNTRIVAEQIARAAGADLLKIVPEKPYPTEYRACVDQAKKEIDAGFRPAVSTPIPDLSSYDTIFVGSPCWWYTIAPPVATFLEACDLSGKTLAPFMTHEGSRMGRTLDDLRKLCPTATITEGLPVRGSAVDSAAPEVEKWLKKIGLR